MYKKVCLIVNPASGTDYPILSIANRFFKKNKIDWELFVTKKKKDAERFAREAGLEEFDLVLSYGGDGTAMEVARGLATKSTALLVLPGGTANILAKELEIPASIPDALELIVTSKIKKIDTFSVNGKPYLLRVNAGVFADFVKKTKRSAKDAFGSFAYAYALSKLTPEMSRYEVSAGTKKYVFKGVGLMVANIGNIGLQGMSLLPQIKATDGYLDLVALRDVDLKNITKAAAEVLFNIDTDTLYHIRSTNFVIKIPEGDPLIFDDEKGKGNILNIKILPHKLSLVVPDIKK